MDTIGRVVALGWKIYELEVEGRLRAASESSFALMTVFLLMSKVNSVPETEDRVGSFPSVVRYILVSNSMPKSITSVRHQ